MKTLRVTLADIVGPTGTPNSTATVHARYVDTSGRGRDVHLTDGTIVVPVRRSVTPGTGPERFDFTVIPSDDPDVREADRGFLTEVSWTITAPEGGKSHGVRRVLVPSAADAVVQLGLLSQPEPVAPYTGGYALAPDLAAEVATRAAADTALDGRVDALEVAPPAHTHPLADVTDAGTAAAADVGDFATAAQGALADSATQPGHAHAGADITSGTVAYARLPVGTAASTLAAGDDSRITGAAQKSANLSDLASASTARTNLGLTDAAVVGALPIPDPGSFYPTDTITAALQLIGGRERYGTGSPEGVVTAPVGTYYTDTAITNGAMRWAKKTGTGNTGWTVVYGDTGFRDITGTLPAALTAGRVLIRRTGTDVHITLDGLVLAGGTAPYNVFPSGITGLISFSPKAASARQVLEVSDAPNVNYSDCFIVYLTGGALYIRHLRRTGASAITLTIPATPAGTSFSGEVRWSTAQAWPTSLPGVAA